MLCLHYSGIWTARRLVKGGVFACKRRLAVSHLLVWVGQEVNGTRLQSNPGSRTALGFEHPVHGTGPPWDEPPTQNSSNNSLSNSQLQYFKKQQHISIYRWPVTHFGTYLYSVGSHPGNQLKPVAVMSRVTCFIWWAHAENCMDQN